MNVFLSLLIYNPLEAYTLVLLCDITTGKDLKFKARNIVALYVFSSINFINQLIPYIWYGKDIFIPLNLITGYLITPILLKIFCNLVVFNVSIIDCFIAQFISCIFIIVISSFFDVLFHVNSIYYNYSILYEFIINIIIFSIQILLYKTIKIRRCFYEEFCKRVSK